MDRSQERAFTELVRLSTQLKSADFDTIKELIRDSIKKVPVATAKLLKGSLIDRVRINRGEKLFEFEHELSYITDKEVINKYLTSFGRANKPHQVMFYGAVASSIVEVQRATAVAETSSLLKDTEAVNIEGELLTVSRWQTLSQLTVAEIVFDDRAIAINPDTRKAFEKQMSSIAHHPLRELALRQIQFFSHQFGKKVLPGEDWEYKITAAYTDIILNDAKELEGIQNLDGIAYPSVPSGYQGQNVVLTPEAVSNSLQLINVSTHRLHKKKMKSFLNANKHVPKLDVKDSAFIWEDVDPRQVISLADIIKNHL